jgi:ubiquinone/menaquinone biosynthesis C-methylase UbiE
MRGHGSRLWSPETVACALRCGSSKALHVNAPEPWQLHGSAPERFERSLVPAVTAPWAADLVAAADPPLGARVLDVACGTGIVARLAAARVGPAGHVVGLDLNPGMLAVARGLRPLPGAPITWQEANAVALPFPEATFDVVLCQQGLQCFPDRPAALREMHRVLAPGGRLALSVYRAIAHHPATQALADTLARHGAPQAAAIKCAEHALADAEARHALLTAAGCRDVALRTVTLTVRLPSPQAYVHIQLTATPLATVASDLDDTTRAALIQAVGLALRSYVGEDGLAFPQEAHVAVAYP